MTNEKYLINEKTYNTLFEDSQISIANDNWEVLNYIETLTLKDTPMYRLKGAKLFKGENGKYIVKLPNENYSFYRLSDFILDHVLKEELQKQERYRKCHHKNLDFVLSSPLYQAVTGYIYIQGKKQLHTVSKTKMFNEDVYLDVTGNIIMSVDDYQRLFNFQVLETLTQEELIEFQKILKPYFNTLSEKVMLTFLREMANDVKKNISQKARLKI